MNALLDSLGVIDTSGKNHCVKLKSGLNIITGKSSTGKSALINIFDYCMGCTRNNIPHGIISNNAALFYIVLKKDDGALILARKNAKTSNSFLKPVSSIPNSDELTLEYFSEDYFITNESFKEILGRFLGLKISDTDENADPKVTNGRPSVRNMISFMLQPQNLIANNQGLFFRFDDSEHKEKVISEFKIFLGLVDQNYYTTRQELEDAKKLKRILEHKLSGIEDQMRVATEELSSLRSRYRTISGNVLFGDVSSESIVSAPQIYLDQLIEKQIVINEDSEDYKNQYEQLQRDKNLLLGERRKLQLKRSDVAASMNAVKHYHEQIRMIKPVEEAYNMEQNCPFCHSATSITQDETNALIAAINWLNKELRQAPALEKIYLPQLKEIDDKISEINEKLRSIDNQINLVRKTADKLIQNWSLEQQAHELIVQVSYHLEAVKRLDFTSISARYQDTINEIERLDKIIKDRYNIDSKLIEIEIFLEKTMSEIAQNLSFEKEYQPVKLHFDVKKFDLYCLVGKEKVFLSSMGSAANWLYSHLCLFLALLKLFCMYGNKCTIPPILFIDQPSQVYFPTTSNSDKSEKFEASNLSKDTPSEDLAEVSNMFIRILDFIENVKSEYGITPQIIVTEHADNLDLQPYNFEDYLIERWRGENEGLISIEPKDNSENQEIKA